MLAKTVIQVKLLVEGLTCRAQRVAQLWLPNLPKKFKELMSRLQKRQETKGLVGGVVMAEASLEQEECFALASKVASMYKVRGILVILKTHIKNMFAGFLRRSS